MIGTDLRYWSRSLLIPPTARDACERALAVVQAARFVVEASHGARVGVPGGALAQLEAALDSPGVELRPPEDFRPHHLVGCGTCGAVRDTAFDCCPACHRAASQPEGPK